MSLVRYPILQMAYVVDDIEQACLRWANMFDAGPFLIVPHFKSLNGRYRGGPAMEDVSHALGYSGEINIQFTQQHNDAPSIWRDMHPAPGFGPHHIMIMPDDFDEEVARFEAAGCMVAARFDDPMPVLGNDGKATAKVAYLDARDQIGCFVELFENCPVIRATLGRLRELHHDPAERGTVIRETL